MKLTNEINEKIKIETDPVYEKVSKVIPKIEWSFHVKIPNSLRHKVLSN